MMTITLELSPQVEAKLRESIARHDAEAMRQLLAEAFAPTVETLLQQASEQLDDDEFEALADQLADEFAACVGADAPVLSDYDEFLKQYRKTESEMNCSMARSQPQSAIAD